MRRSVAKRIEKQKIAHYDLESICKKYDDIAIDDIEKLVKDTASILDQIGTNILCSSITLLCGKETIKHFQSTNKLSDAGNCNYEKLVEDYKKSILELKQG